MLGQAGQGRDQAVDERRAELAGRPGLQRAEVQLQPDDREMGVLRRADVDGAFEDAHAEQAVTWKVSSRAMIAYGRRGRAARGPRPGRRDPMPPPLVPSDSRGGPAGPRVYGPAAADGMASTAVSKAMKRMQGASLTQRPPCGRPGGP